MKQCAVPAAARRAILAVALLLAAASAFPFRAMADPDQSPAACAAIGASLLAVAGYLLLRTVSLWGQGVLYDQERITFVLSRKDRRSYRWEELAQSGVTFGYPPDPACFFFPDGKTLAVTPRMTGREELIALLRQKNFPAARSFWAAGMEELTRMLQATEEDSRRR